MTSPAIDFCELLSGSDAPSNISYTLGDNLFVGAIPAVMPGMIIAVYDSGGNSPNVKQAIFYPSVTIMLRCEPDDYENGYNALAEIRDYLNGQYEVTINSMRYLAIMAASDITALGRDENNRPLFSLVFNTMRAAI